MKSSALLITDPLCSWCWGTLPEIEAARRELADTVQFDLIMAGLQVGTTEGLAEYNKQQLYRLWHEVHETTGQTFCGSIPEGFIYHSELACRAVELARHREGGPPWHFFHSLQSAFYVDGLDINRPETLADLLGMTTDEVAAALADPAWVNAARANFAVAKKLSANALPGVYLDNRLVCGGYVTADQLVSDIRSRLC